MPEDDTSAWTPIKEPPVKAPPLKVGTPKEEDTPSEDTSAWTPVPEVKAAKLSPKEEEDKKKKEEEDLKTKKLGPYSIFNRNRAMEHLPSADQVIDFLRPIVAPAVGGTVGTASALAASPLTPAVSVPFGMASGAGAYALTDALMQRMRSQPENSYASKAAGFEPGGIASTLTNTAEMAAGGKLFEFLGGKLGRGIVNTASELSQPGSVVGDIAAKLKGTYSQTKAMVFGKDARYSRWIEDIFDGVKKKEGQAESLDIGRKLAGAENYNPNASFSRIQGDLGKKPDSATMQMMAASTQRGNTAAAVAENNAHTILVHTPAGPVMKDIAGPIHVNNALSDAQATIKDLDSRLVNGVDLSDDDKQLRGIAQKIINETTTTDPTTGVTHQNPLSFRDAWTLKKAADELAYTPGTVAKNDSINLQVPSATQRYFKNLSQSLNEDIETSMKDPALWPNDPGGIGLKNWKESKAIAGQRQVLLNNYGSGIKKMINDSTTSLPALDAIIQDPKELRRVLAAGETKFPGGGQVVTTTREDIGAYKIKKLFSDATSSDPSSPNKTVFNPSKLINDWNDPAFADSKRALFSRAKIENYNQLFKNLAETQIKGTGMGRNLPLWITRTGVALAPNLVMGHLTAPTLGNAAVTGVGIGATVLAKIMNDDRLARALVAASSGQALNVSQDFIARQIARAAQGGTMTLFTSDGKSTKMDVDSDGKMTESH